MPSPPLSIVQSLSPRIAILSSDDVVASCEANGCRGLEELLRPWEGGTERVSILSSTLAPAIHPTFPLRFVSYASVFPLPEQSAPNPDIVVDLISSHVSERNPEEEQHYALTRGLLLSTRPIGPYETFNHPVGFMIAISTSTPEPMETLQRLVGRAMGPMSQAVPWLDGVNVMRFFVVLHDVSKSGEDLSRAYDLLASVKKTYGPHSTLLVINSQIAKNVPPLSPDTTSHPSIPMIKPFTPDEANPSALSQVYASALSSLTLSPGAAAALMEEGESESVKPPRRKLYGARLTAEDTQRLAALVRELVVQSLIPWMEGRIREWNEVWQTNRRGLTGRLFGAGRKLFGSRPSSPAPNAQSAGYNTVKGYYPVTAVEAITRRLADFGFMLRDYRFASTVYDSLRRDFAQDRAWRYAAASTEMYGLSLLLAHNYFQPSTPPNPPLHPFTNLQHTDISSWLEQAVLAYQGRAPANQIQLDALRVTVLYYEAWRAIGEWRGVGMALVKAAGEADEVPSAVMIEEAAAADVKSGKTGKGKRRRAFHLVLAAQRYETAGLKKYSRRCLERASQTYCDAPWTAAQARIEYSLARQAYTLGESATAVERFLRLLRKEDTGAMGSQAGLLEDMALAYEQLSAHPEALVQSQDRLQLPTPVFDVKATRIILPSSHASTSGTTDQWHKLEQQALKSWDRKGKKPMTLLSDRKKIVASVNETFTVELLAVNPLDAPLKISELTLVTSPAEPLTVTPVADFELEPYESRVVPIQVVASTESTITITAASFLFHRFFPCSQSLERKGQRLHTTKAQRITPTYAKDSSLTVAIGQSRPRVELEWSETPEEVFVGEQVELRVRARNAGKVAVENLQLFMNEDVLRSSVAEVDADNLPNRLVSRHALALHRGILQPGEEVSIPLILSAHRPGRLDFLSITLFSNAENEDDVGTSTSALSISVVPLLALSAEVRPSRSGSKEYLVGIEATNISTHPVVLDKIEPISAFWNSKASEDQADLLPNQSFRSNHRVLAGEPATDLTQKSVVEGLSRLVSGQTDVSSQVPSTIALCAKPATDVIDSYLASRKDYRIQYLQQQFPTIPLMSSRIFPLIDPLDLDFVASWRVQDGIASRRGVSVLHGVRVSPEFSIVEDLRKTVQDAILKGGKTTRTMYEETGRLRQVLMDSVLEGVLSYEDDPLEVVLRGDKGRRVQVGEEGTASVTFTIRNRSPHLSVRWVLDLNSTEPRDGLNPLRFSGELTHRGQLAPFGEETVEVGIWALDTGLHGLIWTVYSETGVGQGDDEKVEGLEDEDKAADWTTRKQWVRREEGWVEVVRGL